MTPGAAPHEPRIDAALVRALVRDQFPQWAGLDIAPVVPGGWDNRTFRLGETMTARLPSRAAYAPQAAKEHEWLPFLAAGLPVEIPALLGRGEPGRDYPWRWSVLSWIEGEAADRARIGRDEKAAAALAGFLLALQAIDPVGGPAPGADNFHRGGPLATYDGEVREASRRLGSKVDGEAVRRVWEEALASAHRGDAVWLHGDLSPENLILRDGALAGVIDFGGCAVGDPACDLAIAWTGFEGAARATFRDRLGAAAEAWPRGRGWALWKALIEAAGLSAGGPLPPAAALRLVEDILADDN